MIQPVLILADGNALVKDTAGYFTYGTVFIQLHDGDSPVVIAADKEETPL